MHPVEDADAPRLSTYLCYGCGFHPNTTLMEDEALYVAYQNFYACFKETLKPKTFLSASNESKQGNRHIRFNRRGNRTKIRRAYI